MMLISLFQRTTNQIIPPASTPEKPESFTACTYARIAYSDRIFTIARITRISTFARIITIAGIPHLLELLE